MDGVIQQRSRYDPDHQGIKTRGQEESLVLPQYITEQAKCVDIPAHACCFGTEQSLSQNQEDDAEHALVSLEHTYKPENPGRADMSTQHLAIICAILVTSSARSRTHIHDIPGRIHGSCLCAEHVRDGLWITITP